MTHDHPPRPDRDGNDRLEYDRPDLLSYRFAVDRRGFFKSLGGLVVVLLADGAVGQESGRARVRGESLPADVSAWLHIAEDGSVTVFTGKVEVGQNARTALTQAVAEELHAPLSTITLVMGDTDRTPFDMGTFGSRTTPTMAPQLRKAAATARETLCGMAADTWAVDRSAVTAAEARVVHKPSNRSLGFGELTRGKALVATLSADVALTAVKEWTVGGHSVTKVNAREIVTGRHRYTSDLTRPEMWHGKVLRPPSLGATLVSADISPTNALKDATVVRDGDFVGAAGARAAAAAHALDLVKAQWKTVDPVSDAGLYDSLKKTPPQSREAERPSDRRTSGSLDEGLAAAHERLEQTYTVAYIAHAPLEPRAAVAEWSEGKLTVWTGTQRPFGVRSELAEAFRLSEDKVRVVVPDTGSGYGGKHTGEAAIEAARLARAASRPVKVVWTREEEFSWAYFRPAGVIEVRSGSRADGTLTAWDFHTWNCGPAGIQTPYDVPHQVVEFHPAQAPLRQGSYRGLAATANHFAREVHMDEIARALAIDALELRRRNLKDARLRAVLDAAAERFGWPRTKSPGCGCGIAAGVEKGSYVAACAEVEVEPATAKVRVVRLVAAFECGAIVNPDHLLNQVEGSLVMGLGGALFEAIRFDKGQITTNRFSRYRVPRFSDMPQLDVVLLDRKDLPSAGAGETPIVATAPAVANAIFDATGQRLRALPLAPETRTVPS
jgi:nicotinate dehydrogenase subunit B